MKNTLLVTGLIFSSVVFAKDDFVVKDIKFEGLQRLSPGVILLKVPFKPGDTVDPAILGETVRSIYENGDFSDIQILNDNGVVTIKVRENPTIVQLTVSGNKLIKEEQIKENLRNYGVYEGNLLDRSKLNELEKAIEDFYYSAGKYSSSVKIVTSNLPRNRVDIKVIINEGVSSKIKQINILGNNNFSSETLLGQISLRDNLPWWNFVGDTKYQKQKLAADLESIKSFYLDNGYAKFKIISTNVSMTPNKKDLYITINLEEGSKYEIDNIKLSGTLAGLSDELRDSIVIKKGATFSGRDLINSEEAIKKVLSKHGYAFPTVTSNILDSEDKGKVSIHFAIDAGKRFYVNSIIFSGNDITRDQVLRREMRQFEGSWLAGDLVQKGKERLDRTGFFERVESNIERVPGAPDKVNVIYKVKERNTGSFNVGLGYGTDSGVSYQVGVTQDNWLGSGKSVSFNGVKNRYQNSLDIGLNEPYFTPEGISLGGKLYYNSFKSDNQSQSFYNLKSFGMGVNSSIPLSEYQSINFGIDLSTNKVADFKPQLGILRYLDERGIKPQYDSQSGNDKASIRSNDLFYTMGWGYNSLNRGYFPTQGTKLNVFGKITIPGSDNSYYKISFDGSNYQPLNDTQDWVFLSRIKLGYADGLSGKSVPFYDNFYSGGSSSVRGFSSNSIGPKAVYLNCNKAATNYDQCDLDKSDNSVGGNAVANISAELIFPTPFVSDKYSNALRTSFFVDAGTVWDTKWKNTDETDAYGIPDYSSPNNFRVSSGIALQWQSPLGPLVFSYALPLKKENGDKTEQFQFNIGKTW